MKANSSRIAIVLDRSGSMEIIRKATIDGFNEFIRGQRVVTDECRVKLVQFDHEIETVWDKPLYSVPELTIETYVPRGNTALYDAMGRTIQTTGDVLAAMSERERPAHVIVMVLTDGQENASQKFSQSQVAQMVRHQREQYQWEFIFLGANQDAVLTAQGFGIPQHAAMSYTAGQIGTQNVFRATTAYSNSLRSGASNVAFSTEDRTNAVKADD